MPELTSKLLRERADGRSFERALQYTDSVTGLRVLRNRVVATVTGSDYYEVRLSWRGAHLVGECTCPYGEDGAFCKHCVAVGLVLLRRNETVPPENAEDDDLREYLRSLDHEVLVELLYERAGHDDELARALRLRQHPDSVSLVAMVDETGASDELLSGLRDLADQGAYDQVLLPVQRMLEILVADSDDVAMEALELHVECCLHAKPDPVELADWLVTFRLGPAGWLEVDLDSYAEALGETGAARYREEVARIWQETPEPGPFDQITTLMKELAGDDVDVLVGMLDGRTVADHDRLRVATMLRDAQRIDEAVAWAAGGLDGHFSDRFAELLVDLHTRRGRHREALMVRRNQFGLRPSPGNYELLRAAATPLDGWTAQRAWALDVLEAYPNMLTVVLLREGDTDAAWQAAQEHGCTPETWIELAATREEDNPLDAAEVYRGEAERRINMQGKENYAEAAKLLVRVKELYAEAGHDVQFLGHLAALRARHKAKRNLMAALAARGL